MLIRHGKDCSGLFRPLNWVTLILAGGGLLLNSLSASAQTGNWTLVSESNTEWKTEWTFGLAVDGSGALYVSQIDYEERLFRVMKRDPNGPWSPVFEYRDRGPNSDQGQEIPWGLAVDDRGNLYVAGGSRIDRVDAQGKSTVIASTGNQVGQVNGSSGLAVDAAGNLYVAEVGNNRIQKRTPEGKWSVIFQGKDYEDGSIDFFTSVTADRSGQVYIAMGPTSKPQIKRIMKRDAQGEWSVVASYGTAVGQFAGCAGYNCLATDSEGNLYVAENRQEPRPAESVIRVQKRDRKGNWSVIAGEGREPGQVPGGAISVAVDRDDNLYVIDHDRIQKYTPPRKGDLNGDASVNVEDAILTLKHVVGQSLLTTEQAAVADMTGEGEVNVLDSVRILRIAVDLDSG